ncbi:MAG TPA: winged helix-turn-helix domain-containing protein [Ideonella sp.]|uniref:ATP-binding protein n=1 Tax=Ideonella sp. TaxID=1929293 RepID=UPI002C2BAFDF|nr:winged helix-turn-helix domain-containing protein [Ideonella sp.]HSI49430.1 winged helix-turn-helix domain-containing protein [Ideonella sp.]
MTGDLDNPTSRSYAFGRFALFPERRQLLDGDTPVRLGGRALDLLIALVESAGETVDKRALMQRAWPTVVVEEGNLKVHMASLRRLLGDTPPHVQFIATDAGRGYRFVARVRSEGLAQPRLGLEDETWRHNLPIATTRIVGRAETIETIQHKLADSRLISIVGAGGIGKTTVALAAAEGVLNRFEHGVFLVELAPLKDPALVPHAIATAIGLTAHSPNMLAALSGFLRHRRMLLLLDSCEHLIAAAADCADRLLSASAGLKIIATSREPLALGGERVLRLPGLEVPPASPRLQAERAQAFPAVQLFVDRASDRLDGYRLSDADAPLVAAICRRLDGLALAIELAATRIDAFGVRELLAQLDGRISLLQGRAGTERHRTLTATIDWSYELLAESERKVMRRLSVFAGVFGLASASVVAADDGLRPAEVRDALASLVAKSLLVAEVAELEARYRQLDTTRAYAAQQLLAAGELPATRRRHALHFLQLAQHAAKDCVRLSPADWIKRHAAAIDDLRAALDWAFEASGDDGLAVRLGVVTIPFWKQLSLVAECRSAVERLLGHRFDAARSRRDELVLHLNLGATLLHTHGPLVEVKAALTQGLAIAEEIDDSQLQLECLRGLSEYELWSGDSRSVLALSERIRAIAETLQHGSAGADADAQAGSAFWYLADFSASRRSFESIISRPMPLDLRSGAARSELSQRLSARGNLASLLWLQGLPDQAVELSRRQREEAEASCNAVLLCYALIHGSVVVSLYVRDHEAVARYLALGENHAEEHGLTVWQMMARMVRGRLNLDTGQAFDFSGYRETLADLHGRGFRMRYPNYLTNYAEALARQGDLGAGLAVLEEAFALARSQGNVVGVPEMLRIKGNMLRLEGRQGWDGAVECFTQSIQLAQQQGGLSWVLRTASDLVELWRECGGSPQAEALLASTHAQFSEGLGTGDLRRARALIDSRP